MTQMVLAERSRLAFEIFDNLIEQDKIRHLSSSLDGHQPLVLIWLVSCSDCHESLSNLDGNAPLQSKRKLNVFLPIANAFDWSDGCRGSNSKRFRQNSLSMSSEYFVNGNRTLNGLNSHLPEQDENRIAHNPWKDGPRERRCDGRGIDHKEYVHQPAFFY